MDDHDDEAIPRIRPGIFFSPRSEMPRGRHALDRDAAQAAQAERLMAAFAELVAARGLAAVTVGDVVARAGVSRAAFYASFDDLAGCADAAYERFIAVVVARLADAMGVPDDDWPRFVDASIRAYLDALMADPVVARAMQLEMDAAGKPARTRRQRALGQIADVMATRHRATRRADPSIGPLSDDAFLATIYGVRQLACDALDRDAEADLAALAEPILRWIAATVHGAAAASRDIPLRDSA